MDEESLLIDFCKREIYEGCYEIKIKDIPIYKFIERDVRKQWLHKNGVNHIDSAVSGNRKQRVYAKLKSILDIFRLLFKKTRVLFYTFRLEDINGAQMDKFYDPIIEIMNIPTSKYAILETNRGRYCKNRLHKENVYYDDFTELIAWWSLRFTKPLFIRKYKSQFSELYNILDSLLPDGQIPKETYTSQIIVCLVQVYLYRKLLGRLKSRSLFAASRSSFMNLLCAAKMNGISVLELQHGIEYGTTLTYSGKDTPLFTPDKFLMFGDVEPKDVYGIDTHNITNIGWAFGEYIESLHLTNNVGDNDALVVSQPGSTEYILKCTFALANAFPNIRFHIRCHPMEKMNTEQLNCINSYSNVCLQDTKITFVIAIKAFDKVIGEESTALYESLSYGKKTAVLAMYDKSVRFLKKDDSESFFIIKNEDSFKEFLTTNENKSRLSIYSNFNKENFSELIKI